MTDAPRMIVLPGDIGRRLRQAGLTSAAALGIELEMEEEIRRASNGEPPESGPVFEDAFDFVARQTEVPKPLLGDDQVVVIPAGGLVVLAGRPGSGKTTLIVDMACHLAAGVPWPPRDPANERAPEPLAVPRPIRVALVENEGPEEMFRQKLKDKLGVFPHQIGRADENDGCLVVHSWRWGAFSFADRDSHRLAREQLEELRIDLVVGDPLGTLGTTGVGSPQDTRDFVALLRPLGLGTTRSFLFLHHFRERVERAEDELSRISGAWGGHLDTLVTLSATSSEDQARMAWPKLRWARQRKPEPLVLGRIWTTQGWESLALESDTSMLEPILYKELAEMRATKKGRKGEGWATYTELARSIERNRTDVRKALEGAPHMFVSLTGEQVKALGAKHNAILWGLKEWVDANTIPPTLEDPIPEIPDVALEEELPDW